MEELGVILEIPLVDDDAVADEPEAVGKHERVGKKKEEADPEERWEGDDGFVEAGVHQMLLVIFVFSNSFWAIDFCVDRIFVELWLRFFASLRMTVLMCRVPFILGPG